jgi:hypothetical protein
LATLLSPDLGRLPWPRGLEVSLFALSAFSAASSAGACLDYIRRGSRLLADHSGGQKV